MKLTYEDKMMVAGHRGDSYNGYENTMEAFRMAIEEGADMIETDVRLSSDGMLVLMHDDKVDRTTDGKGLAKEKTFEELRALNAGGKYEPLTIPTLNELLQLLSEHNVLLNLEIKEYYSEENKERCEHCIDECVKLIEKYRYADKMVFNSFDAYVLEYIAEKYEGRYLLHGFYPYSSMQNVKRNPDEYLYCACIFSDRKPENYQYLQERGIEPWIGAGVTKEGHLKECYEMGAKLVTTNFPADCIEKLKRIGAR
ncbi:MAG: hypothetical protein J6B85_02100 [Lachnospiraceae bacterium]|nr:hypothetical protein [Lachnospiraceae bacterium]